MLFTEQVVALVRKACPYFIWDGTVRVDIMQAQNQQLIVNELESFEANICSPCSTKVMHAVSFMTHYWKHEIQCALNI